MSVDIKYLASRGVSDAENKLRFNRDPSEWTPKHKRLMTMIASRIRDGRTLNLDEWRAYYAIDKAYGVPFRQTTPSLVNDILSRHMDEEQTVKALAEWGISEEELFLKVKGNNGAEALVPNPPVFFNVIPNLVKAYTTAVKGKLFNARNRSPLLPFNPAQQIETNQVLCEIITNRIDRTAMAYGYPATLDACIDQMLKYGITLAFPREEWHCEQQVVFAEDDQGQQVEKKITVKEGLRYFLPHPTRFYYDLKYPLTSINTDTGVEFGGHWHVLSYGQIMDNRKYWNRDKIFAGTNWFQSPTASDAFWKEVNPCSLKFPRSTSWGSDLLREDKANLYSQADRDKAIFVTEHYEKLIPRDWDLGDYRYPVWFRFTMAADYTPIFVEPCAFNPMWFMGYDYSENNDRVPSLALEVIPWQDWLGNLLSQILLTAKQNLLKVIFYDTEQCDAGDITKMKNLGETMYRGPQFLGFSSLANKVRGVNHQQCFWPVNLAAGTSISEMMQMLPVFLNIMQRVLLISAQSAGSAGPHQQGKKEIELLGQSTSEREDLIGSSVDAGMDAWQLQLYEAHKNYADARFEATVDADTPKLDEVIKELGFTVVSKGENVVIVRGSWKKIELREFARTNEGAQRNPDKEAGQAILNAVTTVAAQADLHKEIGSSNLLQLMEFAAKLMGAPQSFRLRKTTKKPPGEKEVEPHILEAIQAAQTAVMKAVEEKVVKPVAEQMGKEQQEITQLQQQLQELQKLAELAKKLSDKQDLAAREAQSKEQARAQEAQSAQAIKQAEAQAEEARKSAAFAAEERRKDAEVAADIERKRVESEAAIASRKAESAAKLGGVREASPAK